MNDAEALTDFRLTRSERAFAALVASQINLAYSVALRCVRDAHLADDVTQAVFIILAEKAAMLPPSTNISGWIFRTTQYVAKNALRAIARRRRHEEAFAKIISIAPESVVASEAVAAIDLALTRLGRTDQEAVLLKYYRGKSWHEVGDALGLSEEAARKRIHRVLVRLRRLLPEGIAPTAILFSHAIQPAPAPLAGSILQGVAAQAAPHASALALAKGTLLATTKLKIPAIAAMLILAVIPASLAVMHLLSTASAAPIPAPPPPGKLPFTLGKETTGITSPLHDDGTVDYVAALNDRYGRGVTPDNNAFVDWLQIVGTDSAGFRDDARLWQAANGASFLPDVRSKPEFLNLAGTEQTPPNAKVWQPFFEFFFNKYARNNRPPHPEADDFTSAGVELWSQQERPDVAEFLDRQDMFLNAIVAAADKPNWWMPAIAIDGRTLVYVLRPEIVSFGQGGGFQCEPISALCARATFRMKNGDFGGFKRDVIALKQLARRVGGGPTFFEGQTGAWIDNQATRSICAVAGAGILSAAQCADLLRSLDALEKMPDISEAIDVNERWIDLDLAAAIATGEFGKLPDIVRSDGDKRFASVDRDSVDWNLVLKEINSAFDDGVAAMKEPRLRVMMQRTQAFALRASHPGQSASRDLHRTPSENEAVYSHRVALAIMTIWPTQLAYRIAEEDARTAAMEESMLKSLLTIAQTKAETGKWPQSYGQLPPDIYSLDEGATVQYQVNDRGAFLYSVGPNGVDDDGRFDTNNHWDDIAVGAKP